MDYTKLNTNDDNYISKLEKEYRDYLTKKFNREIESLHEHRAGNERYYDEHYDYEKKNDTNIRKLNETRSEKVNEKNNIKDKKTICKNDAKKISSYIKEENLSIEVKMKSLTNLIKKLETNNNEKTAINNAIVEIAEQIESLKKSNQPVETSETEVFYLKNAVARTEEAIINIESEIAALLEEVKNNKININAKRVELEEKNKEIAQCNKEIEIITESITSIENNIKDRINNIEKKWAKIKEEKQSEINAKINEITDEYYKNLKKNVDEIDIPFIGVEATMLNNKIKKFKDTRNNIKCSEQNVLQNPYANIIIPYKNNYFIAKYGPEGHLSKNITEFAKLFNSPVLDKRYADDVIMFKKILHQPSSSVFGFSTNEKCYVPKELVAAADETFYTQTSDSPQHIKKCIVMRIYEQLAPLLYLSEYVMRTSIENTGEEYFVQYLHDKIVRWQLQSHHLQIHRLISFYIKCASPSDIGGNNLDLESFVDMIESRKRLFEEVGAAYLEITGVDNLTELINLCENYNILNMCIVLVLPNNVDMINMIHENINNLNENNSNSEVLKLFYIALDKKMFENREIIFQQLYEEIKTSAKNLEISEDNYYLRALYTLSKLDFATLLNLSMLNYLILKDKVNIDASEKNILTKLEKILDNFSDKKLEILVILKNIIDGKIYINSTNTSIIAAQKFMYTNNFDKKLQNMQINLLQNKIKFYIQTYFCHKFSDIVWDLNFNDNFVEFVCSYYSIVNLIIDRFANMRYILDNRDVEHYISKNFDRANEKIIKFVDTNINLYINLRSSVCGLKYEPIRMKSESLVGNFSDNRFILNDLPESKRQKTSEERGDYYTNSSSSSKPSGSSSGRPSGSSSSSSRSSTDRSYYKTSGGYSEYKDRYLRIKNELK